MRPSDPENQNQELKERLNKAKVNANRISKSAVRLLHKRKSLPIPPVPSEATLLRNKEYDNALRTGNVEHYKVNSHFFLFKLKPI